MVSAWLAELKGQVLQPVMGSLDLRGWYSKSPNSPSKHQMHLLKQWLSLTENYDELCREEASKSIRSVPF